MPPASLASCLLAGNYLFAYATQFTQQAFLPTFSQHGNLLLASLLAIPNLGSVDSELLPRDPSAGNAAAWRVRGTSSKGACQSIRYVTSFTTPLPRHGNLIVSFDDQPCCISPLSVNLPCFPCNTKLCVPVFYLHSSLFTLHSSPNFSLFSSFPVGRGSFALR